MMTPFGLYTRADGLSECSCDTPAKDESDAAEVHWEDLPYPPRTLLRFGLTQSRRKGETYGLFYRPYEIHLHCSTKRPQKFTTEFDFLGHRMSKRGIEPDEQKAERIRDWPSPRRCASSLDWYSTLQCSCHGLLTLAPLTTKET